MRADEAAQREAELLADEDYRAFCAARVEAWIAEIDRAMGEDIDDECDAAVPLAG